MNDVERRQLIEALIAEIQIYEERKPNGQWLKSIRFKLPIIENDLSIGLDNGEHVETIVLFSKLHTKQNIEVELEMSEMDLTAVERKATYEENSRQPKCPPEKEMAIRQAWEYFRMV